MMARPTQPHAELQPELLDAPPGGPNTRHPPEGVAIGVPMGELPGICCMKRRMRSIMPSSPAAPAAGGGVTMPAGAAAAAAAATAPPAAATGASRPDCMSSCTGAAASTTVRIAREPATQWEAQYDTRRQSWMSSTRLAGPSLPPTHQQLLQLGHPPERHLARRGALRHSGVQPVHQVRLLRLRLALGVDEGARETC